ncbi:two-component response regulator [Stigmatella aurantiaca DW4/3-1]|uniref:Two-component response regulator n=2 Tax=Stigmatella aurantiaca (strain DW4/3-1) TaxID=378806 RepID=Q08V62_STIAD|nr:two-component response regulator [Stigmatella aurantiaca DW4/3-1]
MMSLAGKCILIADDEEGIRDLFRFTLEPLGVEVVTVSDGWEAFEAVQLRGFDLIILDVHMPRLSGPEVLVKIRELRPAQRVLVVSSSSDASHAFEQRVSEFGASACLYKPVELDELLSAIERALSEGGKAA